MHADVTGHAGITDSVVGTIVTVDPNTGITTTVSDNFNAGGTDDIHDHDDETDIRTGGTDNDTANQTDTSNLTVNSNGTETVTQTNPDGSQASPTTVTTTTTGNDAINAAVGIARAANAGASGTQGSSTTTTITPSGTETGGSTSSDPAVGSATWSNRPLDQTTLNQFASSAAPLSNVSTPANGADGAGGGPGQSGGSPPASGSPSRGVFLTGVRPAAAVVAEEEKALVGKAQAEVPVDDRPGWVKVGDAVVKSIDDWKLLERATGFGKAVGGTVVAGVGLAGAGIGVASEIGTAGLSTPASVPLTIASAALALFGVDVAISGTKQMVTGNPTPSESGKVLSTGTNNPVVGEALDDAVTTAGLGAGLNQAARGLSAGSSARSKFAGMSNNALNRTINAEQHVLPRQLFKGGSPAGLTRESLEAAAELSRRALANAATSSAQRQVHLQRLQQIAQALDNL